MIKVLFVCMGNICRSPTARGVFAHMVAEAGLADAICADSAATSNYHVGEPPDARATEAARRRGYDLTGTCARQATAQDFRDFDMVLAVDHTNYTALARLAPPDARDRLHLLLDFAPQLGFQDVPDPYYGGPQGFDRVLDIIEAGTAGLLAHIRRTHAL